MDRLKGILAGRNGNKDNRDINPDEYEPLRHSSDDVGDRDETADEGDVCETNEPPFSWFEYAIFLMIGVAMLWAWNMFLAASPYFASRFLDDPWSSQNFQSAILSVSTLTNLGSMLILTNLQRSANYPNRIKLALVINTVAFALLTISTKYFRDAPSKLYLSFLLVDVFFAALATGLFQNGAFAFATSFGRPEYMQAIMAGQGVAGVLPALAQMVSVLVVPPPPSAPTQGGGADGDDGGSGGQPHPAPPGADPVGSAAFLYFLTAVLVSVCTLVAFLPLVRRHDLLVEARMDDESSPELAAPAAGGLSHPSHHHPHQHHHLHHSHHDIQEAEQAARKVVSLPALFRKLHWLAGAIFMCFVATMFFPVFTSKIFSVREPGPQRPRLFAPEVFIPLAFFFWNLGDLVGRVSTMGAWAASARRRPVVLFAVGIARLAFLPLYMLCNIRGGGAVIPSDVFYLLIVQFPYGLTNGWLASNSMMGAGEWVEGQEREAAGGFMGLCLVAGLAAGSLLSFTAGGI